MKQSEPEPRRSGTTSTKRAPRALVGTLRILVIGVIIVGFAHLTQRESDVRAQQAALEARSQDVAHRLDAITKSADSEIERLRASLAQAGEAAQAREDRIREDLDRAAKALGLQELRLSEVVGIQEARLARSETEVGQKIERLAAQLAVEKCERSASADGFRTIQQHAEESVFLIHCVFTYETKETDDDDWKPHEATTWGTAFAVADDGYLITNKHLVMPWKFDSELCALKAMGEVRVQEGSVRLAAWPVGSVCLDPLKKANFLDGFSTDRGTLSLVTTADDTLNDKSVEMGGKSIKYKMHALDNHDLAVLRVTESTKALQLASEATEEHLKKLDPVLAIGFPRGAGGLESTSPVPSATLGAVRKIEDTIHISAPIVAGNSGGPVFAADGSVIGIATRIYSETLGICIKAEHARKLMAQARLIGSLASAAPIK